MGAPFSNGTWNGVEGAYYVGAGGGLEGVWLLVSIALCVAAIWIGHRHETKAYDKANK